MRNSIITSLMIFLAKNCGKASPLDHSTFLVVVQLFRVFFFGTPRRDSSQLLKTHDLCSVPGNVLVDPSASDRRTAPLNKCVRKKPTNRIRNPMLFSTGKLIARIDETKKDTQSFKILTPRFARNVPAVNFRKRIFPHTYMVGQPKNHISDLNFEKFLRLQLSHVGGRFSKQCVLILITLWKQCVGLRSRDGYFWGWPLTSHSICF